MNKKYLVATIFTGVLVAGGLVGANAGVESSTFAGAEVNAVDSGASADTQIEVKVESDDTSTQKMDSAAGSLDSKVDAIVNKLDANVDLTAQGSVQVAPMATAAKVVVRGWDADKREAVRVKVQAEVDATPKMKSVAISEDMVEVDYSAPGKLLGIFPMDFNLHVWADSQAWVKVKFPWYRFLLKTEFANTAELLNGVFQHNQTNLEFLKSRASEDRQVEIFVKISNSLKIMHEMSKPIISNIRA